MTTTVTMTMPMLTAMMLTKMAMAINYDDDEEKTMAIWYFRGATGPVAVIPLACGRLELGLWPCGRLEGKWLWMGTRSTTMMIAICLAFRPPSGSMRTIDFLHAGFLVIR